MSRLRVQAILEAASEKREDDVMNVFHFNTASAATEADNYEPLAFAVRDFYQAMSSHIPSSRKESVLIKIYDLADPTPRSPVYENRSSVPNTVGDRLPTEVALVLSLYATETSGVPRARRRGRLYFGPLLIADNAVDGRPTTDLMNDLASAAVGLAEATNGAFPSPGGWCVYSPTDDVMRQIHQVAVDDAFDTQRRRGVDPVVRTVTPVATGP